MSTDKIMNLVISIGIFCILTILVSVTVFIVNGVYLMIS